MILKSWFLYHLNKHVYRWQHSDVSIPLIGWYKMPITQEWHTNLWCMTCLCNWHEILFFQTGEVCHKLFMSIILIIIFFCLYSYPPTACYVSYFINAGISSNMTFIPFTIFGQITADPMNQLLSFGTLDYVPQSGFEEKW